MSLKEWIHNTNKAAEENLTPVSEGQREDYIKKDTWKLIVERDKMVEEKGNNDNEKAKSRS